MYKSTSCLGKDPALLSLGNQKRRYWRKEFDRLEAAVELRPASSLFSVFRLSPIPETCRTREELSDTTLSFSLSLPSFFLVSLFVMASSMALRRLAAGSTVSISPLLEKAQNVSH